MSPQEHPAYRVFSTLDKKAFIAAQGNACFYCGQPFSKKRKPTRDHFYPRCEGNGLFLNKVYAHAKCNTQKGCRHPTHEEVQRVKVVYMLLGLPDFTALK